MFLFIIHIIIPSVVFSTDPINESNNLGKSINYHGPISKRGNRYARKILFNCSRNIVTISAKCDKENPICVYYQKKKQEGKHYYACLTACSTKLIRIIYALCMNNSTSQN